MLVAIINEIGITFLSIFFSFFTSMGITVRVKLKMSWIIMVTMFIIVFINIAFIINEIIKSIMFRNKKQMQEVDPDVKGTEGDEQLKAGKGSPHQHDDGIAMFNEPDGKKPKRINPKKIKANKDDISSQNSAFVSSNDGKKTSGFQKPGSSGKGSSGSNENNIIQNSSNDSSDGKTPAGEPKGKKDIRKSGYGQTAIQNQISMRRAGQGLGERAREDFADDVLVESDAGFDNPPPAKKPTRKTRKKKVAAKETPGQVKLGAPDYEGDMF